MSGFPAGTLLPTASSSFFDPTTAVLEPAHPGRRAAVEGPATHSGRSWGRRRVRPVTGGRSRPATTTRSPTVLGIQSL
jgi:hypothetical protein